MAARRESAQSVYLRFLVIVAVIGCLALSFMYMTTVGTTDELSIEYLKNRLKERESQLLQWTSGEAERDKNMVPENSLRGSDSLTFGTSRTGGNFNSTKFHEDMTAQSDVLVRELVFRRNSRYWLESKTEWPKDPIPPRDKFVTFSPWKGGFNNIRMSLEMAAALALALNRTLVMPPDMNMYLRGKSSLSSYFDYEDLRRGVSAVTYEEFFDMVDFGKYQKERPSRTMHNDLDRFYEGLKTMPGVHNSASHWPSNYIGGQVVYCIPNCPKDLPTLARSSAENTHEARAESRYFANFAERLFKINTDTPEIRDSRIIHFPHNLLGHFYTMVYFRNPQEGRKIKRFVRDHIHFREEIFERAERIISRLGDFKFSCLHIRRNEFQFKDAWTPAEQIVENTKGLFKKGEKIYISTDELSDEKETKRHWSNPRAMVTVAKHTWFEPMKETWGRENVFFLSDFFDELLAADTPDIWIGCVESIVCSRARNFVGTLKSTFSGYIHRVRGYMPDVGQKLIMDAQTKFPHGYQEYFRGPEWSKLGGAYGGGHPYWGREYREAWENVYDPLG